MRRTSGFTLLELMMAVVVVGILTAIAMPSYRDYVTRGKIAEAISNLADMRVKLEQYFQDRRTYVGACVDGTPAPKPPAANQKYFDIDCPTLTATTFTVTATGRASVGMGGFVYTVDQLNNQVTTGVPSGWTAAATCWVVRKGAAPASCS
jgi:type IV pilus assembly protein PilE